MTHLQTVVYKGIIKIRFDEDDEDDEDEEVGVSFNPCPELDTYCHTILKIYSFRKSCCS